MFVLHAQSKIPNDDFGRNLAAHKISATLSELLKTALIKAAHPESDFLAIAKSPAFFGVNNAFALMEYFKNSNYAKASQLNLYVCVDEDIVSCVVIDDGIGITEGHLFDSLKKDNKLINYFETQLIAEDGEEKKHIKSSKRDIEKAVVIAGGGGEGLGLAIISRTLKTGEGTLEIGNVNQLPHELIEKAKIASNSAQNGAAIALSSPLHSAELEQKYEKAKSKIMQDSNHRYLNYCTAVEQDFHRQNTPFSPIASHSAAASSASEDEPSESELDSPSSIQTMLSYLSHFSSPSSSNRSRLSLNLDNVRFDDSTTLLSTDSPKALVKDGEARCKSPLVLNIQTLTFKEDESEDNILPPSTPRPG